MEELLDLDKFVQDMNAMRGTAPVPGHGIVAGTLVKMAGYGHSPLIWKGEHLDGPEFIQYSFGFGLTPSQVWCAVTDVAPPGTPDVDPKDSRIQIVKAKKPASWLAGDWHLTVPTVGGGTYEKWCKTKRDAVAYAVRHLGIVDFHNAAAGG